MPSNIKSLALLLLREKAPAAPCRSRAGPHRGHRPGKHIQNLAGGGKFADIDGDAVGRMQELPVLDKRAVVFWAISALRWASAVRLAGTRRFISTNSIKVVVINPNHTTGRASRKAEKPVACITTSSLSRHQAVGDIIRRR